MQKRISIADVARAAGVNHSTASRALSNHPHIAAATRARVLALAEKMGYRPEPALAAMARDRWLGRGKSYASVMAYLCDRAVDAKQEWHHGGAVRAANRLGYRLEIFERSKYPDDEALTRTLLARGIQGLLVRNGRPGWRRLELPWEKFAVVLVGLPPDQSPWADGAVADTFGLHRMAMREALTRGYERPGMVLLGPRYLADEVLRIGGAFAAWNEQGHAGAPPILWIDGGREARERAEILREWLRAERVDAVLGQTDVVAYDLRAAGGRLGKTIGYASLAEGESVLPLSRALPDLEGVGENAVVMLAARLHQRIHGLPVKPVLAHVTGYWIEGRTLKPRRG